MTAGGPPILLFAGDSITDCDRLAESDGDGLGGGYVRMIASDLRDRDFSIVNRGISGDRVADLRRRWDADVVAATPDVVTILVGINDTWRRYSSGEPTALETFDHDLRDLVMDSRSAGAAVILMEPFALAVVPGQEAWREDLQPKIEVVREIARGLGLPLVSLDAAFAAAAAGGRAAELLGDGVHPTPIGHRLIADAWLETFYAFLKRTG